MSLNNKRESVAAGQSVLVPVDFSAGADKALLRARALVPHAARIILLHVIAPNGAPVGNLPNLIQSAEVKLRRWAQGHGLRDGATLKACVRAGVPFQEILNAASEEKAELIVLATHSSNSLGQVGLSRTSDRVSRYARCPVLLVQEDDSLS